MITVEFAVHTVGEANLREHWGAKARRAREQRGRTRQIVASAVSRHLRLPVLVTLTRTGMRRLDPDNLANSFKHVQDGVADALHVNDGDDSVVRWVYKQQLGKGYSVRIDIEQCACVNVPPERDGATGYVDNRACPFHGRHS